MYLAYLKHDVDEIRLERYKSNMKCIHRIMMHMLLTWVANAMADYVDYVVRETLHQLLGSLPLWFKVVLFMCVFPVLMTLVFIVWMCSVYVYRGWTRLMQIKVQMYKDFTFFLRGLYAMPWTFGLWIESWQIEFENGYNFIRRTNVNTQNVYRRLGTRMLSPRGHN